MKTQARSGGKMAATAHCRGLSVSYSDSLDCRVEERSDVIRLLVPGGAAEVFHASYRARNGQHRETLLRAEQVCVVPATHSCEISSRAPAHLMIFSLDRAFCEDEARQTLGFVPEMSEPLATEDPLIRSLGNTLRAGFRVGRPPSEGFLEAISPTLARCVNEKYGRQKKAPLRRGLPHRSLQCVLEMIRARLGESIRVADLAAAVNMSPFHFARMFKHTMGQAPHVYVTEQRMQREKELLSRQELSIREVGARVGYQTQAHFTGVFHANVGMTPRQYRDRHRAERRQ